MPVLSHDDVYQIAISEGASPDEASFLAAVAGPESGYNTQAHNPNASTGDNSYGLLQINMLGKMGENRAAEWGLSSYDDLYDPATNIRAGLTILRSQGKKAWTTYTSGAYKSYVQPVDPNAPAYTGGSAPSEQTAAPTELPKDPKDTLESRLLAIDDIFGKAGLQLKGPQ